MERGRREERWEEIGSLGRKAAGISLHVSASSNQHGIDWGCGDARKELD